MTGIFDSGMQPERTALAWRRTSLAMAIGSLAALRIFPRYLGAVAIVPALLAFALAVVVLIAAHLRYRRDHGRLMATAETPGANPMLSGGLLVTITAAVVVVLGLGAAIVVIVG